MTDYHPMLLDTLGMFLFLGVELSILFLAICFLVSLLQCYIPESRIQGFLSGKRGTGYFFAALLGAITPFCSCSTIPMLRGLLKAKAGFGPVMVFLFASPLLNPIILGLFVVTFGLKTTILYGLIALTISLIAGFLLGVWGFERYVIPEKTAIKENRSENGENKNVELVTEKSAISCCCASPVHEEKPVKTEPSCCAVPLQDTVESAPCCATNNPKNRGEKRTFRENLRFSANESQRQFRDVLPYLILGIGLGSVVYGFVPSEFIATYASGDNPFAVPIAAVIGIPLYVRMEALIPLSAVFAEKGMGLGAIMALLIGGSGASITELILLKSIFRTPMMVAFLAVILGMGIFAGYLFQYVL